MKKILFILFLMSCTLLKADEKTSYSFNNKTGETIKVTLNNASQTNKEMYNNQNHTFTPNAAVDSFKVTFGSYQKTFSASDNKVELPTKQVNGTQVFDSFKVTVNKDKKNKENVAFILQK